MLKQTGETESPTQTVTPPAPEAASPDAGTETDGDLNALTQLIGEKLSPAKPPEKPKEAVTPPDDEGRALSQTGTEPPETEAASARDGDDETGKDETDEDDEPKGLTPEAQHALNRRIAKEVEKRKALEAERDAALAEAARVERLEAELAGLREQLAQPEEAAEHPLLAKAKNEADLARVEADARKYARWADRQLERLKFRPAEVEAALRAEKAALDDWSEESMADFLLRAKENAEDLLEATPRKRQKFEGQRAYAAAEKQAVEQFKAALPWLANRKSDEFARAEQVAASIPGLKALPQWPVLAAMLIEGGKAVEARLKKPGVPVSAHTRKPPAATPQQPTRPSAEPAPINAIAAQAQEAKKQALNTGKEEDVARYLERVL